MTRYEALESRKFQPNWQGLVDNILRKGTPDRVHHMELFLDGEIIDALCERFGLVDDLDPAASDYASRKEIAVNRFVGFDFVRVPLSVPGDWPLNWVHTEDTAELAHSAGRGFVDNHRGPISNWEEFEAYPWPDPNVPEATDKIKWHQENLPEDMCIIASGGFGHIAEYLTWLMGYEPFCIALFEQPDLVEAIAQRLVDHSRIIVARALQFDRVKIVWGSDDMGFKTGLLMSPDDMRRLVLAGHKTLAGMSHEAGRPYILHSCGKLDDIMEDLIEDVKVDAKHSFEDTIQDICADKHTWGKRMAMLGGIDVDFLCRSDEQAIRKRVRKTIDECQPGGGFCLGTGNSVANYIPLENYMAMIDESMAYGMFG